MLALRFADGDALLLDHDRWHGEPKSSFGHHRAIMAMTLIPVVIMHLQPLGALGSSAAVGV